MDKITNLDQLKQYRNHKLEVSLLQELVERLESKVELQSSFISQNESQISRTHKSNLEENLVRIIEIKEDISSRLEEKNKHLENVLRFIDDIKLVEWRNVIFMIYVKGKMVKEVARDLNYSERSIYNIQKYIFK